MQGGQKCWNIGVVVSIKKIRFANARHDLSLYTTDLIFTFSYYYHFYKHKIMQLPVTENPTQLTKSQEGITRRNLCLLPV